MSLVSRMLILALTAITLITATASIAGEANASSKITCCYGDGTGPTAATAKRAALDDLLGTYRPCTLPATLVYDIEGSNGVWSAEVHAACTGSH